MLIGKIFVSGNEKLTPNKQITYEDIEKAVNIFKELDIKPTFLSSNFKY